MLSVEIKKKYNNYIIFFYFSFTFFFWWSLIDDYGVTIDDYIYHKNGENTYLYVKNLFLSLFDNQIDPSKFKANINVYPTIYEVFLVFTCKVLNITDFREIYLTAHRINFLLFFSSLIVFFIFCQKIFENH